MKLKHILTLIILFLLHCPLMALDNFYFVGHEPEYPYQTIDEVYPPLNQALTDKLNQTNIAAIINKAIGNLYTSHGCIHISPSNAKILFDTIPLRTPVKVYPYSGKVPQHIYRLPDLVDKAGNQEDIQHLKEKFTHSPLKMHIFPRKIGFLSLNGEPFASFDVIAGPPVSNYPLQGQEEGELIFDKNHATPTPKGEYKIYKKTDHFYARLYPYTSKLKQGTPIKQLEGQWKYMSSTSNNWIEVPELIKKDLTATRNSKTLLYYDVQYNQNREMIAAKWGGHPFGKYSMLLMDKNNKITSILIHTNGELLLEQKELLYYLAAIFATDEKKSWSEFINGYPYLKSMKIISEFIQNPTSSKYQANKSLAFYKMTSSYDLSSEEKRIIPEYYFIARRIYKKLLTGQSPTLSTEEINLLKKYGLTNDNRIIARIAGIYTDALTYQVSIEKSARWYTSLRKTWNTLYPLRKSFNNYFREKNIQCPIARKKICFNLLYSRMNFNKVTSLDIWLASKKL